MLKFLDNDRYKNTPPLIMVVLCGLLTIMSFIKLIMGIYMAGIEVFTESVGPLGSYQTGFVWGMLFQCLFLIGFSCAGIIFTHHKGYNCC